MSTATVRSPDGRVVLDARLRRRRIEVRRDAGRRRLQRLGALLVIVAVLAAGYAVTRSPLLAVRAIEIDGAVHVTAAELSAASGIRRGVAMTDVDAGEAEAAMAALPWVDTAKVSRDWPGDISISIVERTPVAAAAVGDDWALLDVTGRVLARVDAPDPSLTVVDGLTSLAPGDVVADADVLLGVVTRMPAVVRDQVASVGLGSASAVELHLTSGGVITFGGADELSTKYVSVTTMLDHLPDLGAGCTLDVSVPQAPTLTPEEGCA